MEHATGAAHTSLWWGRQQRPDEPWEGPAAELPETPAVQDVVVVGAGLTGLCTAVQLARGGSAPLVLEARHVAAGTTGHSTAKLSLLQGSVYSGIAQHAGETAVRAYAQSQRAGLRWLLDFCGDAGVAVERRDAWTYAVTSAGAARVREEARVCAAAGLDVEQTSSTELPFAVEAALRLPDQAQLDPVGVCQALRRELESLGGRVVERVLLTGVTSGSGQGSDQEPATLTTTSGELRARRVVLATGIPVLDRGLYFAQVQPQRSYALAFRVPDPTTLPRGMYLSVDDPTRSLRTAPDPDGELLLVGGNNHVVGRSPSPSAAVDDLVAWTSQHFADAALAYSWAAQDYQNAGRLPIVGVMPRSHGQVLVATGFNKWGIANAAAAGMMLAAEILDGAGTDVAWAGPLQHRRPSPRDLLDGLAYNASVGERLSRDWAVRALPVRDRHVPDEGAGYVERGTLRPTAICTVAGRTHRVDAVCPHLGGILAWNDSDLSWDCPLHGSRFTADGHRIEGPALRDLHPR